jgi:hypothetical protein
MHENEGLVCFIQKNSNNNTSLNLRGHNFLILVQNQLLSKPINVLAQGATNLFENMTRKWLIIETLEFEPLSVQSWASLPYVNIFNLGELAPTLTLL